MARIYEQFTVDPHGMHAGWYGNYISAIDNILKVTVEIVEPPYVWQTHLAEGYGYGEA